MKYDQESQLATEASKSENHIVYKCKKELCRYILNLENQLLEEPVCWKYLETWSWDTRLVRNFYKILYTGEDKAEKTNLQENPNLLSKMLQIHKLNVLGEASRKKTFIIRASSKSIDRN